MVKRQLKIKRRYMILGTIFFLLFQGSLSYSSEENLNEVFRRKSRLVSVEWGAKILENTSNQFYWQPETLCYQDIKTGSEIWRMTYTPRGINTTQDISLTHFSADGNRILFHSKRNTMAFNSFGEEIWMLVNTDGSRLRPAINAASRLVPEQLYPLWSPNQPDVFYQGGTDFGKEGLKGYSLYALHVSDSDITRKHLFDLPDKKISRIILKKSISADGKKLIIKDFFQNTFYVATVFPESMAKLDTPEGYSSIFNFDYYWGKQPIPWAGYHDQYLTGNERGIDGIWFYLMPEETSGSWWRTRLTGSGVNSAPLHKISRIQPYKWGGEIEPVNTVTQEMNQNDPWCPPGREKKKCMEYMSHFTPDRWGHYGISSKCSEAPFGATISDLRKHTYVYTFTKLPWVQHHDWEAFSDWSVSSGTTEIRNYLTDRIAKQNYKNPKSQHIIAYTHTRYNRTPGSPYESLARPIQSPDGTKVLFNSTFLNGSDSDVNIFWAVAYYPYPPELTALVKTAGGITISWDFKQSTKKPRTYATRGWPNESEDLPPSPREIKQFRIYKSIDGGQWTYIGSTPYNNVGGLWSQSKWNYDILQEKNTTFYYGVTSVEFSGLESQTLSNVWRITLDDAGEVLKKIEVLPYPLGPGGHRPFLLEPPESPVEVKSKYNSPSAASAGLYLISWKAPRNPELIRYYNIYADDGLSPAPIQARRIASIPATSDYKNEGIFSFIDWSGSPDGTTQYTVTAVNYQGKESLPSPAISPDRRNFSEY